MLKEFQDFIARGNVMDLAVGIIIGSAFTAIVKSLVGDVINPILGVFTGGIDFTGQALALGRGEDAAQLAYGNFLMAVVNFMIVAWVVFLLVKGVNRARDAFEPDDDPVDETPPAPSGPTEIELLTEIRDALRARDKGDGALF
ncbi:MAG: large conductance mechanosensitive channel protein MscL [Paracoccaceae bacterium]